MKLHYFGLCIAMCICLSSCDLINSNSHTSSQEQSVYDQIFTEQHNILDRFANTDGERADLLFEELIKALEGNNNEALTQWFSVSVRNKAENFDESIHALLTFYDGSKVSYRRFGPSTRASREGSMERKELEASYDITTTTDVYRIAIKFCTVDTETPDNIGVTSLYITKAENSDMNFTYWGKSEMDIGIHIEQPTLAMKKESIDNTVIEHLDEEYEAAINGAISNIELCEINERYTEEWQKIIEEYYDQLQAMEPDTFAVQIEKDREQWTQYVQTRIDLELQYLQEIYGSGTILPVVLSHFICEIHREKAIELIEMYTNLIEIKG